MPHGVRSCNPLPQVVTLCNNRSATLFDDVVREQHLTVVEALVAFVAVDVYLRGGYIKRDNVIDQILFIASE